MVALRRIATYPLLQALLLGAVAACGFQPLALWPLTLLGIAGLIELTARAGSWKQAALVGWFFGVGHFVVGNGWIATAFTYQANMPQWLGWMGVVLLALYLAIYPMFAALGAWLIARGARHPRIPLIIGFAACWIVAEWLRSWVFTGYAWNPLAMAALGPFDRPGLAAAVPWLGTYGLSGLVALVAGCWLLAWQLRQRKIAAVVLGLFPVALFLLPSFAGPAADGTLRFTLVQPDIRQETLNDPAEFVSQFRKTAGLSGPLSPDGDTRLVLWPESGVPFYLATGYPPHYYIAGEYEVGPMMVRRSIGEVVGPGGMLLTGTVDLEMRRASTVAARNVITAVGHDGSIAGSYAKAHLVPFGEYLPLRSVLEPLGATRLVPGSIDFWPGPGPRTVDLGPWGQAGMQICYEIVFSGQVADPAARPDYIFNPSNDGWFGDWGPPQHLAQARMRAIEEGLPVLRATTTGISAVIDADGIVRQHIPRHVADRRDGFVPPAHPPTLFARAGNMLPLGWAAVLLVLCLVALRRPQG